MCPFPFEERAVRQQRQNMTFLNTNTGRLQLFDLSALLWQHGIRLLMHNDAACQDHPIYVSSTIRAMQR